MYLIFISVSQGYSQKHIYCCTVHYCVSRVIPYIANYSRWKSFVVAIKLNICGWTVVLHGQIQEKFCSYQLIHKNHETFPP